MCSDTAHRPTGTCMSCRAAACTHPENSPVVEANALCQRLSGVDAPLLLGEARTWWRWAAPATAKATAPATTTGAMAAEGSSGVPAGAMAAARAARAFSLSRSARGMAITSPLAIMRMDPAMTQKVMLALVADSTRDVLVCLQEAAAMTFLSPESPKICRAFQQR